MIDLRNAPLTTVANFAVGAANVLTEVRLSGAYADLVVSCRVPAQAYMTLTGTDGGPVAGNATATLDPDQWIELPRLASPSVFFGSATAGLPIQLTLEPR